MQQTTCGVTPKIRVLGRKTVDDFLKDHDSLYENLRESQNCLYAEGKVVSDKALNYLNTFDLNSANEQLKILIKKEFAECEALYPFLGDFFIDQYFSSETINKKNTFLLHEKNKNEFLNSINDEKIKQIGNFIFEKTTLEYGVSINKSMLKDIHVEKIDMLNFDLEFDTSYLGNAQSHTMKEYKFIIIDGHIDSVGEIHHLLDSAYKTKTPHVIFCFGMNSEVEHVIKYNNTHGKFEIIPVVIEFNENTINVLNDIAVLHKSNIVSSKSGQTISQAMREELSSGIEIIFHKKGFKIKPKASQRDINIHKDFLRNRISEATHDESRKLLINRLKRFSSKSLKIFLPNNVYQDNDFLREIDYLLRFLKHSKKMFYKIEFNNRTYFLPSEFIGFVNAKVDSLKNTYQNIEKVVINARN